MPRPALHDTDAILDAARDLVLEGGPRAATIERIIARSGAPRGSIYHRFGTRDDLLARMWIRAVRESQRRFLAALGADDPVEAGVAAALSVPAFVRERPADARLLASLRREDLVGSIGDPALAQQLDSLNEELGAAIAALARRLHGRAGTAALERVLLAVVDLPLGAVRRHLVAGAPLPKGLPAQLEAAVRAALAF